MSWNTPKSEGFKNKVKVVKELAVTLPSSVTTEYGSEIDFIAPDISKANQYVSFGFNASAVTGTNLDIALYGAYESGGTKFLLLDAVVADITATGLVFGVVDINAYPAPYYYLGWTSDDDESANTIDTFVIQ
jgi:hypothetical protein